MSTLKVDTITDSSGGNTAVLNGVVSAPSSMNFRNRIINGDMRIDQRNNGASVTPVNNQYLLDRWVAQLTQLARFSVQQNAGAVTAPIGFSNYLGVTSLSAYSVLAGDTFLIDQRVEGFNFADMAWGTAAAQPATLSFWARSSLTGTFGGALTNSAGNRSYAFSYTINSANTWEYKTVTVVGDTTGTWIGSTNGTGVMIRFGLGSGSTFTTAAGSWAAGNFVQPTGSVSVVGTNGATFYITGVQLEAGSAATPFERRPYGTELALCQRYLPVAAIPANNYMYAGQVFGTTNAQAFIPFSVVSRVAPTGITAVGSPQFSSAGGTPTGSVTFQAGSTFGASISGTGISGFTVGNATSLVTINAGGAQIFFNGCEL